MKRKSVEQVITNSSAAAAEFTKKNLRSKIPRRKRSHISPIIVNNNNNSSVAAKPTRVSVSNCDEVSCNTTLESVVLPPNDANGGKQQPQQLQKKQKKVLVSENSCVESCSVVVAEVESNRNGAVSFSVAQHSPANTTATVEQKTAENFSGGYDFAGDELACDESLSYDDYELTSAAETSSEIFSSSNGNGAHSHFDDFTDDYSPSIWMNSGSQFSDRSYDDDSPPSPCFSLFKEFKQQFLILNFDHAVDDDDHYVEEIAYWTFEEDECEESYKLLRSRERNQAAKVTNYIEEYHNDTVYGGVIAEQRLVMVNWIIQLSRKKDLQSETMFLAVRLFDRFLSKGCFTSKRNLQILGIACLTLAIRIEENQPGNSVRQKCFYVGSNIYSRTEIVAMEWVVQEVLKFHLISTTIYNFLWFYLKAAGANEQMQKKAEYLASLTLLDHMQLRFWPSSVAAALVILVSLSGERDESCQRVMEVHVRTKIDDLPECIKSLEWLVQHAL